MLEQQPILNYFTSTSGLSRQDCVNILAGVTNRSLQDAMNIWAGTSGLTIQDAVNVKAGTSGLRIQEALQRMYDKGTVSLPIGNYDVAGFSTTEPNTTAYTDGAIQFTASDKAYLSIADASQTGLDPLTSDFSYSFWINPTSFPTSAQILSKGYSTGYELYITTNGTLSASVGDGSAVQGNSSAGTITTGSWQHITAVYNRSGNLYVYKNGNTSSPIVTLDISSKSGSINSVAAFQLGGYVTAPSYYNGAMDSFGFWNKALSADEVTALYNSGNGQMYSDLSTTQKTNLVSWWDFNEEGGRRYDAHGTNHLNQVFANIIDNTSTLGSELVTNGTFDSDTTGWTAAGVGTITLESVAGGQSGNCIQLTRTDAGYQYVSQVITTVANQNYTLSYYHKNGTSAGALYLGTSAGGIQILFTPSISDADWQLRTVNFKALTTTTYITLAVASIVVGQTSLYDTVSIKPLTQTNLNGGFESQDAGETLGSELLSNPGFETAGGGGADVFANWTDSAGDGALANETTIIKSGSHAAKLTSGATSNTAVDQTVTVSASTRYKLTFWTRGDATYAGRYQIYDVSNAANIVASVTTGVTGTTYTQITQYFTTPAGCTSVQFVFRCPSTDTGIAYFDDVSLKQVTAYAPFLNWVAVAAGLSTINVETTSPNSGTYAVRFDMPSSATSAYIAQSVLTSTHKYKVSAYVKSSATSSISTGDGASVQVIFPTTTSYVLNTGYFTAGATSFIFYSAATSKSIYIDDVTLICTEIPSTAGIAAGLAIDGNLCSYHGTTSQYLTVNNNSTLQGGNFDFTIFGWYKTASVPSQDFYLVNKSVAVGDHREYRMYYVSASSYLSWFISPDGTATNAKSVNIGAILPNTWYFFVGYHDSTNDLIGASINNGTAVTTALTGGCVVDTSPFELGRSNLNIGIYLDGVGFIKRLLTPTEITALYNNGKGVKYAGLPSTVKADTTLSFWNLDEYSAGTSNVTRSDSTANANHLTSTGNTPSGQGVNYYEGTVSKFLDSSGNSKNLTQTTRSSGLLYVTNAQNGKPALVGDGLTKCLYNENDLIGTGNVTVMAVIKPRGLGGSSAGRIIDNGVFNFRIGTTNYIYFTSDGATTASSSAVALTLSTAYVIIVTRTSAGVVNFYINGTLSGTANQASGTPAAGSPTYIGNNAAGTRGFDGDIYEIGIIGKILSATEITTISNFLKTKWGI